MKRSFPFAIAAGAVLSIAACSQNKLGTLGMGESCVRSTQCQAGLACVGNRCTNDISSLAEAGTVPILSEGGTDGAAGVDAGDMGVDAGPPPPPMDAGPPPPPMDAGPPPPPMDAGGPPPPMDAGPPPVDAGPPPMPDAGFDAGDDAG